MSTEDTPTGERHAAVTYDLDGTVAVIRIDDEKANALSHGIITTLEADLHRARSEAQAIVLVGREGKFSAGFDLKTMQAGPREARDLLRAGAELGHSVFTAPVPVVIACTGHALAMGAILLFCADVRIGAAGAFKIGMNEVAIGMPVPRFAIELARERITPTEITAAVNLGRIYDPDAARHAGYLDEVVEAGDVERAAIERAQALASTVHPTAFRLTREYLRGARAEAMMSGLSADIETFAIAD